jgi:hypothetical protein
LGDLSYGAVGYGRRGTRNKNNCRRKEKEEEDATWVN